MIEETEKEMANLGKVPLQEEGKERPGLPNFFEAKEYKTFLWGHYGAFNFTMQNY